jgi:NAD(P)-dependent dehydrogenase (short-subunit alcohol dehydrogenase family)
MTLQNSFSLQDKKIVITGASSGIGRACAIACNVMGSVLLLIGRNGDELEKTRSLLSKPERCTLLVQDLTQFEEVSLKVKAAIELFGAIDGVVHAAGISTTLPFRNISPEKMNDFFQVNVVSALHLTQLLIKPGRVSANGASIVFLSSVMSQVGESAKVLYSMTKGALLSASRSMAVELAPKKIRVNCIAPGVVDTPMSQKAYYSQNEELKEKIIKLHPLGLGTPEDVANACIYLLSDAGRWVTGTQLMIDGGYTAR